MSQDKSMHLLVHSLCRKVTKLSDEDVAPLYKKALISLGGAYMISEEGDEHAVSVKIKKKLMYQDRGRDAALFSQLHCKLQSQQFLRNRWSILHVLLRLSDNEHKRGGMSKAFTKGLIGHAMSTPFIPGHRQPHVSADQTTLQLTNDSSGTSGIASSISTIHSQNSTRSTLVTPYSSNSTRMEPPPTTGSRLHNVTSRRFVEGRSLSATLPHRMKKSDNEAITEQMLLKDVIYAFQGIESKLINVNTDTDSFEVSPNLKVPISMKKAVCRLTECGWLYSKIHKYVQAHSTDRAFGLVGQSFCAALHQELAEYYSLIALLESQLKIDCDGGVAMEDNTTLTLHTLSVWVIDPLVRLKLLAALVDICESKKGGALATTIHSYLNHGDPMLQSCVKYILTQVAQPIFATILRWIYDGELEDTYQEFFVGSDPTVNDDNLWLEKYSLRRLMLPSFLTPDQAKKILLTGKSINFLRQVCQDRTVIRKRVEVQKVETHKVESIFNQDLDNTFNLMIETVYKATSQHLMDVLHNKYKFMEHLKAMRRYLLLGQGDFIRHLMDLLEDYLPKAASTLFIHNLSGVLEAAIRATNAQFDDSDILKRLDVRLLEVSPGDTGWDVFSLDYHVDGAIRTVFTEQCMLRYLRVFNFLWRAKRMEYILAGIWKGQMANGRLLKHLPEIGPILNQIHVIRSEMVHFVQQVQYYINFEVLECTWDDLIQQVMEATDLDEILEAHHNFLSTIIARCLLDEKSCDILTQLRTIFDLIIKFQDIQDDMYKAASFEQESRELYEQQIQTNTEQNEWGTTQQLEDEEEDRRNTFITTFIPSIRSKLQVLTHSYQNMVQQFLIMLANHSDINLRFLSFRLDFNEHYHVKEPRLSNTFNRTQNK